MARSRRTHEPLRLRGTPSQVTGFVAVPRLAEVPLAVDFELTGVERPEVTVQDVEGSTQLTFSVARTTAPGTYEGTVRLGTEEHPLVLEVEPRVQLRIDPRRLHFAATAGETREVDLSVTNLGNVPCELRAADGFGLFDTGGLDRAIGRAFTNEPATGERRLDMIADAAAEGFGGLVRIKLESGAGELAPGDTRDVHAVFALPDRLEQGRNYWGTWNLYNVNYVVRVDVTADRKRRKAG